jgi:hypothetical protein
MYRFRYDGEKNFFCDFGTSARTFNSHIVSMAGNC